MLYLTHPRLRVLKSNTLSVIRQYIKQFGLHVKYRKLVCIAKTDENNVKEKLMKTLSYASCIAILLISMTINAEPSSTHLGKASKHSALAASHGVAGSAQVASAVVAVPVLAVGSVALSAGAASVATAETLSHASEHVAADHHNSHHQNHPHKKVELEITEITITADRSPQQVMTDNQ